jgi:hypothetical protein
MLIALSALFILPDLPHNSRGFTPEERAVAVLRMTEDVGEADADSAEQSPFAGFFMAVKDVKIYVMMLTFTAYVVGLSFNAFFPTLTRTLGFGYITTLLMSAPPWAFACIVSLINAWNADRTQERFWHIVGHAQRRGAVCRAIPASLELRRLHRILLLDLIIFPPPTGQARSRNRHDQCVQPAGQHRRELCVEHVGEWVQEQLWGCYGDVWGHDCGVFGVQDYPCEAE